MDKTNVRVLYKASELAKILNVNPQTIYKWSYKGLIKSVKIGSIRRFEMPEQIAEKLQEDE